MADFLACQGVKKTQVDKALASLSGKGQITCKEFGKTKIYFPIQDESQEISEEVRRW